MTIAANGWGCETDAASGGGTKYVTSVLTSVDGVITVTASNAFGDADINGKTITLTPMIGANAVDTSTNGMEAVTSWVCAPGTMPAKFLPGSCK